MGDRRYPVALPARSPLHHDGSRVAGGRSERRSASPSFEYVGGEHPGCAYSEHDGWWSARVPEVAPRDHDDKSRLSSTCLQRTQKGSSVVLAFLVWFCQPTGFYFLMVSRNCTHVTIKNPDIVISKLNLTRPNHQLVHSNNNNSYVFIGGGWVSVMLLVLTV